MAMAGLLIKSIVTVEGMHLCWNQFHLKVLTAQIIRKIEMCIRFKYIPLLSKVKDHCIEKSSISLLCVYIVSG